MGDLWRSQPMQLVQLFINLEAAHDTVDELGELGLVQFRDVREKRALVFGEVRCNFRDEFVALEADVSAVLCS